MKTSCDGKDYQHALSFWCIGSWGGSGASARFGGLVASSIEWRLICWRSVVVSGWSEEKHEVARTPQGVHRRWRLRRPGGRQSPKDGPSAGITIATALASIYTGAAIRSDTAMTGEITLIGLVLPIGGVKEKVLAARRADIRRVILPTGNEKDLRGLPENVRTEMEFIGVERIEEVFAATIPALAERLTVPASA